MESLDNISKVHVVILNYRSWKHTIECIRSIERSEYNNIKIWIVEICDLDNSREKLNSFLKDISVEFEIIYTNENNGFSASNNIVLSRLMNYSESDYVFILNNDTEIEVQTIELLIQSYSELNKTFQNPGIIGPKLMFFDDRDKVQFSGGKFNPKDGIIELLSFGNTDSKQADKFVKSDFIIGAAMFLSVERLKKIGLMDEQYFLYCEDIDWNIEAENKNYNNFLINTAKIYHHQGVTIKNKYLASGNKSSTIKHMHGSYLKLYRKRFPELLYIAKYRLFVLMLKRIVRLNFYEARVIFLLLFRKIL